jgi:hypothetical protein
MSEEIYPDIRTLSGYMCDGVRVWGDEQSIKRVMDALHSHDTIESVRTNLRHWREEAGKLNAKLMQYEAGER